MERGIIRNVAVWMALLAVISYCLVSAAAVTEAEADHENPEHSWISWAKDTFSGGYFHENAQEAGEAVAEKAGHAAEKTKEAAGKTKEAVSDAASGAANYVSEKAGDISGSGNVEAHGAAKVNAGDSVDGTKN